MDAAYLKLNVYDALTQAMTAMAVKAPDDKIEFLGQYLLEYVKRKGVAEQKVNDLKLAEAKYQEEMKVKSQELVAAETKAREMEEKDLKLAKFLDGFYFGASAISKKESMDQAMSFLSNFLDIPSIYIALKKISGEQEYLYYVSSSPNEANVVGKKLAKVVNDDEEDVPARQGISFDAFIVPPAPEEDEEEVEEGEEPKPKLPPPKPQPLVVENVMREKRIKFFGVPKLGAYVAVPFSYESYDHESGCVPFTSTPADDADEEEKIVKESSGSKYSRVSINQELIIAFDSIGKYRQFSAKEIDIVQKVGEAMLKLFQSQESKYIEKQEEFLTFQSNVETSLTTLLKTTTAAEGDISIPAPVAQDETDPDAPAPLASLRPMEESVAVLKLWSSMLQKEPVLSVVESFSNYVLPVPAPVLNLFYALLMFLQAPSAQFYDEFGDLSWTLIKQNGVGKLVSLMASYDATSRAVLSEGRYSVVKTFVDNNNVLDTSIYPSHLPILQILATWLQKALIARENAMQYYREANEADLEVVE